MIWNTTQYAHCEKKRFKKKKPTRLGELKGDYFASIFISISNSWEHLGHWMK